MAQGLTIVFTCVALGVVVVILRVARRLQSGWWAVALGLVLGGALGNLLDRLLRSPGPGRGHVVDFLELPRWPVFNLADSAIVVAAVLMVGLTARGVPHGAERVESGSGRPRFHRGSRPSENSSEPIGPAATLYTCEPWLAGTVDVRVARRSPDMWRYVTDGGPVVTLWRASGHGTRQQRARAREGAAHDVRGAGRRRRASAAPARAVDRPQILTLADHATVSDTRWLRRLGRGCCSWTPCWSPSRSAWPSATSSGPATRPSRSRASSATYGRPPTSSWARRSPSPGRCSCS